MSPHLWTTEAVAERLGGDPAVRIAETITRYEQQLASVPANGDARAQWSLAMDERLRRIAVKVAPTMSKEQTEPWRVVMTETLSDLPAMIALTAAKRALQAPIRIVTKDGTMRRPIQFMNEVELAVRGIAEALIEERRGTIRMLHRLRAEIERAANPVPALPEPGPLTREEIRRMSKEMRGIGLRCGALTQEEIDAALAERVEA